MMEKETWLALKKLVSIRLQTEPKVVMNIANLRKTLGTDAVSMNGIQIFYDHDDEWCILKIIPWKGSQSKAMTHLEFSRRA